MTKANLFDLAKTAAIAVTGFTVSNAICYWLDEYFMRGIR